MDVLLEMKNQVNDVIREWDNVEFMLEELYKRIDNETDEQILMELWEQVDYYKRYRDDLDDKIDEYYFRIDFEEEKQQQRYTYEVA